ncbi:penicillin-binding protein activator [Sphingobium subterraneum]|uniref:ABC-type branched-subunit amino acid transport system substrate-binding protein n=1 Tax=Sphingobium subterraneum TaxID=627688 RepID=A0A841ITX2_9SPHN|nr:penicillin-binding protein activator [Sphingobium subterraneum]MBB6122359.1 ABC-type branched-subunit amino acid transport system substrate-binding protein [Sphingobium subterraneum]
MAETGADRQADSWSAFKRAGRAITLSAALFLAACQTIVPRGTGPTAPPPPVPTGPTQVEPGLPTDTQRHRIALLVPTTGGNAGVGQSIANATTLALLDTSAKTIRVTTYDTGKGAAAAVNAAIRDGNKLILGPLVADDVRVAAPIARAANVPIISFSNDTSVAGNGVFLMGYTPVQSVARVVDYAHSKGIQKFAALVPKGMYGERAGTALLRAVEQAGGTVVSMQTFDRTPASMALAVKKLGAPASYDAVLIADGGKVAVQAAPLIRKAGGPDVRMLGTELWNTESSLVADLNLRGAWFASVSDTYYRQLATKYRTRFGAAPYRLSSLGYDAVLLTIRIAQDWRVGTPFPIARLTDEGGFAGIDGAFRFRRDGIAERALEVQQVDAGRFTVISPAPGGF